jgi:prepilin-type N-terminal cleavage/methylation domain-containing protein/prepilin-type processing-associated H-X9-DG protein
MFGKIPAAVESDFQEIASPDVNSGKHSIMRTPISFSRNRPGFTLIEALVVIAIIGLLLAILLPAIFAAREASRRLSCSNNLKQIALGLTSYAGAIGALPGSMYLYSPLARMLPFIDQVPIYNSLNLQNNAANVTISSISLDVFICPSDNSSWRVGGMTNYAVNAGTDGLTNAPFSSPSDFSAIGYEHVTDGSSTTAAASEWLTGVPYLVRDAKRSVFQTDAPLIKPSEFPEFLIECRDLNVRNGTVNGITKGESWLTPGYGVTLYNHALLPNEHSCTNGTLTAQGAWTVTGSHGGGVNVAFLDGHVQYMNAALSRSIWTAIGTMNGQEATDGY